MNFWYLVRVVGARKWAIAGVVALTLVVIWIAAPKPKVTYEAVCLMAPTPQAMRGGVSTATTSGQAPAALPDRNVILSNLILLAESGEVFQRASDFLALPADEQRRLAPGLPGYKRIPRLLYSPDTPLEPKDWSDVLQATPVVNPRIGGDTGTTSDIIRLRIKLPNGDDAMYIVNAVGVAFAEAYRHKSHEDMRKYIEFLKSGREEARARLSEIESRIARHKQAHKVVAVDAETQNAVSALAQLESARNSAQAEVDEAEAALRDIDQQLARQPLVLSESLPADLNPRVVKLKEELEQAESELRLLATKYRPEHASYKVQEERIRILKESIAKEGDSYTRPVVNEIHAALVKERSSATNRLASASARLAALSAQVARAQGKVGSLSGALDELTELTRDQREASDEYALFAQKLAQTQIAEREVEKTGSMIPFDWSRTPIGPVVDGPRKRVLLVYGFVLSLVLGVAFSVWLDSIDNRLRNGRDVEQLLGLPAIGLIPALEGRDGLLPRLTHLYPLSAAAESYRILRTNILFAHRDNPFKTLMVASTRPGQGATTTICNLAIALAQIGKKVVLIDADLRRPSLHRFFGLSNEAGLSTLLQGKGNPLDSIRQTEIENLIVIPGGPPPLNPSELLASDRMYEIVQLLKDHCDMVLFDTPSTIVFSDGPVLASWLDAVLFVVSANQVPRGTETQALDMLRKAKANIIGTVVNRMGPDNVDSCFFYSRYYAGATEDLPALAERTGEQDAGGDKGRGSVAKLPRRGSKARAAAAPDSADAAKASEPEKPCPDDAPGDQNPFPD